MAVRFAGGQGVELVCDIVGRWTDPAVLLLHGGGQTRFSWGGTALALGDQGFLTFALDARGHGESDWAQDGGYSIDAYAEDLRRVAELRKRFGHTIKLAADANGQWSASEAIEKLDALSAYDLSYIEQPTPPGDWAAT